MNHYGYWFNPNAKFDYYIIGCRWTGYFKPKAGAIGDLGSTGSFEIKPTEGWVVSIGVGDIDIESIIETSVKEALKLKYN